VIETVDAGAGDEEVEASGDTLLTKDRNIVVAENRKGPFLDWQRTWADVAWVDSIVVVRVNVSGCDRSRIVMVATGYNHYVLVVTLRVERTERMMTLAYRDLPSATPRNCATRSSFCIS
jgi:hypothetical protein